MLYVHNTRTTGVFGHLPETFESPDDGDEDFWDVGPGELARDWHLATEQNRAQIAQYWDEIEAAGYEIPPGPPAPLDPSDPEPSKFAHPDASGVNPEWRAWRDRERERVRASAGWLVASLGHLPGTYFPERDGKLIPDEGAWVVVLEEPNTVLQSRFRVPAMSLWRSRAHVLETGMVAVSGAGVHEEHRPHQGVIVTPGGELHLWPHEYVIVPDPLALIGLPGAELHSLGGQPVLDEDQLFYLMSRGISRRDATLMLFATVTAQDYVYVTFPTGTLDHLAAFNEPLALHVRRPLVS